MADLLILCFHVHTCSWRGEGPQPLTALVVSYILAALVQKPLKGLASSPHPSAEPSTLVWSSSFLCLSCTHSSMIPFYQKGLFLKLAQSSL